MRKIYYLFALLLLVMGSTAVRAEKAITAGPAITDLSTLQHGKTYILQNLHSGRGGYLSEAADNKIVPVRVTFPVKEDKYVWTLEINETNPVTYSFKSATDKYIPFVSGGSKSTGAAKGTFVILNKLKEGWADLPAGKWGIKNSTNGEFFNGNGGDLAGWSDGHEFSIHEATVVESYNITYVCKSGGLTIQTITKPEIAGTTVVAPVLKWYTFVSMDYSGTVTEDKTVTIEYTKNYPFETTTIVDGQFAAGTKWYMNKIHPGQDKYWQYVANDVIVNATPSYTDDDAYQWCFTGNTVDGFKIYNKKAGANVMMVYGTSNPVMKENATEQNAWDLVPTTVAGSTGVCFKRKDQNNYINHQSNTLKYWSDTDNGSTNNFILYTPTWITEAALWTTCPEGVVGTNALLSQVKTAYATYQTNPSDANSLSVKAAMEAMKATAKITIEAGKYYHLYNVGRKVSNQTGALTVDIAADVTAKIALPNSSDISMLWKFEAVAGGYKLVNANTGTAMGNATTSTTIFLKAQEQASTYTTTDLGGGQLNIKDATNALHAAGGLNVVGYGGGIGTASAWYIMPVEDIDVVVPAAGYATLNVPFAVTLPQGVTAYGVTSASNNAVGLTPLTGNTLSANTPVVLKADAATYSLPIATTAGAEIAGNKLNGTTIAQNVTAPSYILALINKEEPTEGVCFYMLDQTSNKVGANKAYLPLSAITADAPEKALNFVFGDVLGIGDATATEGTEKEVYYDLSGRRVENPSKGIYITNKGKKVIF